ncbi:hypothetical protein GALL_33090 [mine drainage metagenome]|uniref:Uncharacterized protein n=1 Tax=mine drainage metagenome TaxID=410659 RepID=A0A1J5TI17_9ZZZZ
MNAHNVLMQAMERLVMILENGPRVNSKGNQG